MLTEIFCSTQACATGGRDGRVSTLDGRFNAKLSTPKECGGTGGPGNNPEQFFAVGYAACFLDAMKFVAKHSRILEVNIPDDASVTATVGIGPRLEGGYGMDVRLEVVLPGVERDLAEKLITEAHHVCPYSNAARNSLDITLTLEPDQKEHNSSESIVVLCAAPLAETNASSGLTRVGRSAIAQSSGTRMI